MAILLAVLMPMTIAAAGEDCARGASFQAGVRRTAPDSVWHAVIQASIDAPLPERYRTVLETTLREVSHHVPAISAAVALPGRGLWSGAAGTACRGAGADTVGADTRFQAASLTKTLVAVVVLQLVQEGKLRLDDPVGRWFPDVPQASVMTVDHLLRHTTGLVSFNALPEFGADYTAPADAIAMAAAHPLQFCPGTAWAYSNTGYAMLGLIVERIEDRPLADVLARRILRPCGMGRTVLRAMHDSVAVVCGHNGGEDVPVGDGYVTAWAAGGLATTPSDMVRFWHQLLRGRLLPAAVVRSMFVDMAEMGTAVPMWYGMGVQLYDVPGPGVMLGHSGGIVGFTAALAYLPADDAIVCVMMNDTKVAAEAGLWAIVRAMRTSLGRP